MSPVVMRMAQRCSRTVAPSPNTVVAVCAVAVLLLATASTPIAAASSSSSDASASGETFATFFKSLCLTAATTADADLDAFKAFICCVNFNATSAAQALPLCGDRIRLLTNTTVQCAAPQVMPVFGCCANVDAAGKSAYVGSWCDAPDWGSGGAGNGVRGVVPLIASVAAALVVLVCA